MSKVFEIYQELGKPFGPSGREDDIREAIALIAGEYVDDITTDALGNLICRKKGTGGGRKLLFAAHMDSIGVVATYIDKKGFIRFSPVGGVFKGDLINIKVKFANGTKGVISYEEKTEFKEITLDNLFIDIGAVTLEDAKRRVTPGDFAVFDEPCFEQDNIICGPYLDNRIGCAVLLMAMEQIGETENELYFVFTVQEEVGLRGAGPAAYAVQPDMAVAVDVTDTGDVPECKLPMAVELGKGPAIKIMDRSVICSGAVTSLLEKAASETGIRTQREILRAGGTDTAALQKTRSGILSGAVSIPTRYIHSPSELCAISDVEDAVKLISRFAVL